MITLAPDPGTYANDDESPDILLARGASIGRYVIRRTIGAGTEGTVYEAYDPQLGRRVGIKLLRLRQRGEGSLKNLLKEAQAMARLSHPNVIRVFDAGVFGRSVYMVIEFVQGQTLTAWLNVTTRTAADVLKVFSDVGRGLAAAHQAGIVHRDFKPDNVLVTDDGCALLTDFGVAITASPDELETTPQHRSLPAIGTPAFISPEQREHRPIGPASDQFSFCLALKWALFGSGSSVRYRSERHRNFVALAHRSPFVDTRRVSGRVRQAIARGLQPIPEMRFSTMDALLSHLEPRKGLKRTIISVVGVALMVCGLFYAFTPLRKEPDRNFDKRVIGGQFYCPQGSDGMAGNCFFFQPAGNSHADASALCEARGGSLATCLSELECDAMEHAVPAGNEAWIGLTRDPTGAAAWMTGETVLPHVRVVEPERQLRRHKKALCSIVSKVQAILAWQWSTCEQIRGAICEVPKRLKDELTGHSYQVIAARQSHKDAELLCRTLGGELAAVTSEREQMLIEEMLSHYIMTYPVLWLGATRRGIQSEFHWPRGEPLSWNNFAPRQPDNYEGQQDCLALDQKNHRWYDRYCTSLYHGICEFHPPRPSTSGARPK